MNAALVGLCDTFTASQMTHLIDDMFYSEHIFEKLSVYSEYMQTLLQSQHSLHKSRLHSTVMLLIGVISRLNTVIKIIVFM